MRVLLVLIVALGCPLLVVWGGLSVANGIADQRAAGNAYVVGFKSPGDDCGPEYLDLDITTGAELRCVPAGAAPVGSKQEITLPGFTRAQNEKVTALVDELGSGGLRASERVRIQELVDELAADVPAADRPYGTGLHAERLAWAGGAGVVVGLLGCLWLWRGQSG